MATYTDNYQLTKPTYAEQADIGVVNSNMNKIDEVMHSSQISLAPAYDQSQTYAEGDVVMYELLMYKCISPTTGVWDGSKWERTTASESGGGGTAALDILGEASGAVASFADGASAELAKCIVDINPVQDLHGYDKPWAGGAGKNLFDEQYPNIRGSLNYKPLQVGNGTFTMSSTAPPKNGNANLFLLAGDVTSGASTINNGVYLNRPRTVTSFNGYVTIAYRIVDEDKAYDPRNFKTQVESGSTSTAYEPYENICPIGGHSSVTVTISDGETSTTKTTPLGQTVYGGQLNVLTGELTDEDGTLLVFNSGNTNVWSGAATSPQGITRFYTTPSYVGRTLVISDTYKVSSNYATEIGVITMSNDGRIIITPSFGQGKTLDEFKALLADNPFNVLMTLATPQTVQLTPQEVNSLLGQNNISADTGDIDIVYVKASAPIQPNPTGTPTATLKKLGIEGAVFEVEGGGGGSSGGINYSTTEKVIGTWIDGKPLYQKTYEFGNVTGASASFSLGLSDVDNIMISSESYFKAGGDNTPFPYIHPDANNLVGGFFGNSNSVLEIRVGRSMQGDVSDLTVTIQYTKITD